MIEVTDDSGLVTVRLAHGKANALDVELLHALRDELKAARDAKAVILTGAGTIFCAGVDLYRLLNEGEAYAREFYPALCMFIRDLFEFPVPLVVASNGHSIAGGGLMVMAGDYRLMAAGKGRIGIPELLVGVRFPAIALELARFAVPPQHIQKLIYRGLNVLPDEALQMGLVDEVVAPDQLLDRAQQIATLFASIPAENFRAAKHALRAPYLERAEAESARTDAEVMESWISGTTRDRIGAYLDTVRPSGVRERPL